MLPNNASDIWILRTRYVLRHWQCRGNRVWYGWRIFLLGKLNTKYWYKCVHKCILVVYSRNHMVLSSCELWIFIMCKPQAVGGNEPSAQLAAEASRTKNAIKFQYTMSDYIISSLPFHHYSSARNTKISGRYIDNWPANDSFHTPWRHTIRQIPWCCSWQ